MNPYQTAFAAFEAAIAAAATANGLIFVSGTNPTAVPSPVSEPIAENNGQLRGTYLFAVARMPGGA